MPAPHYYLLSKISGSKQVCSSKTHKVSNAFLEEMSPKNKLILEVARVEQEAQNTDTARVALEHKTPQPPQKRPIGPSFCILVDALYSLREGARNWFYRFLRHVLT